MTNQIEVTQHLLEAAYFKKKDTSGVVLTQLLLEVAYFKKKDTAGVGLTQTSLEIISQPIAVNSLHSSQVSISVSYANNGIKLSQCIPEISYIGASKIRMATISIEIAYRAVADG